MTGVLLDRGGAEGPAVYAEAGLTSIIADLEFDTDRVAAMLRGRGVAAADIDATRFNFAGVHPSDDLDAALSDPDSKVNFGGYNHGARTLTTFVETHTRVASVAADQTVSELVAERAAAGGITASEFIAAPKMAASLDDYKNLVMHNSVNYMINRTFAHEVDHLVEFNTLSEAELMAKRIEYRNQLFRHNQRRALGLIAAAFAGLAVPVFEAYEKVDPEIVKLTTIPALAAGLVCTFLAMRSSERRYYSPLTHKEYLNSPWEAEAETFAAQQVAEIADDTDPAGYPLVLRCKPQPFRLV